MSGSRDRGRPDVAAPEVVLHGLKEPPRGWLAWLTTTDHKRIGIMYWSPPSCSSSSAAWRR